MWHFLIRRIAGLASVLLAMTVVLFTLQQLVPADPARALVGPNAPNSLVEEKRKEMGLDRPLPVQYWRYMVRLAQGDLGQSIYTHNPVARDLARYTPATLELVATALVIGLLIGAAVALPQALTRWGGVLRLGLIGVTSAPIFLTGLLLALLFWYRLGWLPGGGRISPDDFSPGPTGFMILDSILTGQPRMMLDALAHLVLPALTLALPIAVAVARTLASSLQEVYRQGYIRTARAKGLSETTVLTRHALRNAAGPPLSMISLQVALIFNNILIVEVLFAWPGLGLYMVHAFASADLPAVLGVAMVAAATYLAVSAIVDLLRALFDPRLGAQ
jgi:peptide/nickel transport system permease protein/dipeptide transport system permease protein